MRFLIDASLSPVVGTLLNDAGHDAVHVGDVLPLNAPDTDVFDVAAAQDRVILTADTDFGEILARRQTTIPSVVLFRRPGGRRPSEQGQLLLEHFVDVTEALDEGAVVVIEEKRLRVRSLPLRDQRG